MRHAREMKIRAGLNSLTKKAVEDRRRRRSVEASVMKAQSNFDRVRHFSSSPPPNAKLKTRWKALKDGRDRQECQDEKDGPKSGNEKGQNGAVGIAVLSNTE
jgi:hypothetical protein